ncbi:AAA family ATPase [Streptomyces sp. TG1A-8]|uniref:helix-turn-helix transcriptional regulator n=1 Tax=Streptomyces sp. TG1A-8 TaxID=3051385 RepID=UPI00265C3A58|nr:AAA family ATPase [Streptomyces sp. TG1A-8]MDO0924379.1 AAA family ATPase [Streptomyces sp. TG1A-8]
MERETELAVLTESVRQAAAGRSGLVVLEGPDGIGKTTLLRALVVEARRLGLRVLRARGGDDAHVLPLSTARDLLQEVADDSAAVSPAPPWHTGPDEAGLLRRLFLLPCCDCDCDCDDVPHGVLAALHRLVRSAAARGPVLMVVDDAHRADAASLRFLAHTARRLPGLPVLLVLARRAGGEAPLLNDVVAQPRCQVLRPRPLTGAGIGLVAARLTASASDTAFQEACLAATNGNPLLVTRLLTTLQEEGLPLTAAALAAVDGQDMPAFQARIARLLHRQQAAAVRTARAMAVLGDDASPEMCAQLAALDTVTCGQALLALDGLGLVSAPEAGDGRWAFAHSVVRGAVLAGMSAEERAAAHGLAARLLHDSGRPAMDVAEHLSLSQRPVTAGWALAVLREAAREATLRGSPERALELLRPCVPDGEEENCDPELLVELGLAEARVDPPAGVRYLTSALDRLHCPDLRLTALSALVGGLTRTGEVGRAITLLDRCRSEASGSAAGTANAQFLEAQLLLSATATLEGYTQMLTSVSFDLGLPGDTPAQRALLAARAVLSVSRMHQVSESRAAARTVLAQGAPITDAASFLASAASVLLYGDRPHEAARGYRQLIDCVEVSLEQAYLGLLALSAEAHERLGALDEALRLTEEVLGERGTGQAGRREALPLAVRLHTLLDRGDLAAAGDLVAGLPSLSAREGAWQWNELLCARGRLRLAMGDPEAALLDLQECGRRQRAWQRTNPAVSPWWYWAGQAHLAVGERRAALEMAEEAVTLARRGDLPCALASGLELRAAAGDEEHRPALLEEAEAALAGTGAALLLARVRVARGRALHRAGFKESARTVLRKGWEESYALGARPLHAEAHQALLATGARPRRPVSHGPSALTPSERQVADLAAGGRSNAEIAEALFVTQRTVEVHLTSVYRKLGLSGRRELRGALGAAAGPEADGR